MKAQSVHCPGTVIPGWRGHREQDTDHSCLCSYAAFLARVILLRAPSGGVGVSRAFKGVSPSSGFCRELSKMGRAVPGGGGRRGCGVGIFSPGSHGTLGNSHFLSGRLLWVNKQDY